MSWLRARDPGEALAVILGLYETRGQSQYDEAVTQLEHALQSAAHAERDGAAPALIAAALLHDIGHLACTERDGDRRHEVVADKPSAPIRRFATGSSNATRSWARPIRWSGPQTA